MLINYNPDAWEIITEHHTCDYHKQHPGANWAGCTCSSSMSQKKKVSIGEYHGYEIPGTANPVPYIK